jgi:uncharacterized protein (TIGR03437 family)
MKRAILCTGVLFAAGVFAQPTVTLIGNNYGWVSPGSPSYGIAQGSIFAIKGTNLGPTAYPTLLPTPKAGDQGVAVKVTVGSTTVDVPTYYVWNVQVAGVLPSNTPVGDGTLTVTCNNQTSAPAAIKVVSNAFGILTMDSSGQGTAKVCDVKLDSTCATYPALAKPAQPGHIISVYGSGLGPTDGDAINVDLTKTVSPQVWIGGKLASVQYAGRTQFVGLDLINVTIPDDVDGCYVSLVVQIGNYISNFTSIPVSATGAACSDPVTGLSGGTLATITGKQTFALGYASLSHTTSQTGGFLGQPAADQTDETASAGFYTFKPAQYANVQQLVPQASFGSCTVWTFMVDPTTQQPVGVDLPTALDAGTITVTSNGVTQTLQKDTSGTYYLDLKSSSFYSGTVTVAGTGASGGVGAFQASITVPSGFSWTNRADVNTVTRASGQPINWDNAAPGTVVTMTGISFVTTPIAAVGYFTCIAPAEAKTFTIPSWVLLAIPASSSIQGIAIPGNLSVANGAKPVSFTTTPASLDLGILDFSISSSKSVTYQ